MWVRCWGEVEEGECFVTVDRQSEAVVAKVSGTVWHSRQMHALSWLNQSFQPDDSFSIRTRGHQSPIYIGWELWVKENIGGRMMNLYKGWMLSNWFRSFLWVVLCCLKCLGGGKEWERWHFKLSVASLKNSDWVTAPPLVPLFTNHLASHFRKVWEVWEVVMGNTVPNHTLKRWISFI